MLHRQHGSTDLGHLQALCHPMKTYNDIQCTGLVSILKQDRQCTYNVTMSSFRASIVAVEMK